MDQTTDYSKSDDNIKKSSGRRNHFTRRNTMEWY